MLYSDYSWKNGIPVGIHGDQKQIEIITDPYGKRYLVIDHPFSKLIYDSSIIDFRHLNPRHQLGWIREPLDERTNLIKDRDNFPKIYERQTFNESLPILCEFFSLQGQKIAHQKIHYTHLGDPFDGVILYDLLDKPILRKEYQVNSKVEFTELKKEVSSF